MWSFIDFLKRVLALAYRFSLSRHSLAGTIFSRQKKAEPAAAAEAADLPSAWQLNQRGGEG